MRARHRIAVLLGVLAGLAGAAPAAGQVVPPASSPADKNPKLDSALVDLAGRGAASARSYAGRHGLDLESGAVRVSLLAHDVAGARAALRRAGATEVRSPGGRVLEARVPGPALKALAASSAVKYVAQPPYAEALATNGEGPAATGAAGWHAAGFTGSGVKVAIVDLGFTGLAASQARGDIPNTAIEHNECAAGLNGNTDHGTAVAEIVHEMAPGAQLYLACIDGTAALNDAKDFLVSEDVSIANFSVAFFNSARGDGSGGAGTPDAIVNDAASEGILWVNSAGNAARTHYQGTFTDGAVVDGFHQFATSDQAEEVRIGSGQTGCVFVRWDEWPGATTDFDVYLTNPANTVTVASSQSHPLPGTAPPIAQVCFNNSGATADFHLFIQRFAGTGAPRMDLFTNNGVFAAEYPVPSSSILDPGGSPSVLTAGAICFSNDSLEPYSSQGPTIDGRVKPDIAGQDAVTSGVYGPFSTCGSSGFTGTSAASPHTAGAAALLKGANPSFTAAQLRSILESRAGELGTAGKDNLFGSGKLLLGLLPAAPTAVTTGVATGVTTGAATLAGIVNTSGWPTTYRFEFGPTAAYGSQTAAVSAGAANAAQAVTAAVSGLSPSTTYHYRLVGTNAFGTRNGSDATFTTPAAPAIIPPPTGPSGQQGVLGATGTGTGGPTTAPAPAQRKTALVTCKLKGKKVTCTVKLAKAKRATVKLTRGGKVFARASGRVGRKGRLTVRTLRRPAHGRYKLIVAVTDRRGKVHRLSSSIML